MPIKNLTTRRTMLKALTAAGCSGLALGLYTWRVEPHWLELTYKDLPIRGLPRDLEGKILAQISDLHIGPKVDDDYILDCFRRVALRTPDFVAFTGDWITYQSPRQFEQLRNLLSEIPHGRLGTVGILGNHDYGFKWKMLDVADEVSAIARDAGVALLRNETVAIAGLRFFGFDDLWSHRFAPAKVLDENDSRDANLALCHNPDAVDLDVWGGYQGWILAGHTHGGQCKPPFLPPPLLPVKNKQYTSGKFELPGARQMYISRGVGHLLRVRFNVRPEIPFFRLTRA